MSTEPMGVAIARFGVGPTERVGTGEFPYPILIEVCYLGPELRQLYASYTCEVFERNGGQGEKSFAITAGRNIRDKRHEMDPDPSKGIIAFREIRLPDYECECQFVVSMTYTDPLSQVVVSCIGTSSDWFEVKPGLEPSEFHPRRSDVRFIRDNRSDLERFSVYRSLEPLLEPIDNSPASSAETLVRLKRS